MQNKTSHLQIIIFNPLIKLRIGERFRVTIPLYYHIAKFGQQPLLHTIC